MARLHLLGTGAPLSDPHRTTTMLALESAGGLILIDCGGDAAQRLLAMGLNPARLSALIVTHEHADHVAGLPLLMEKLWLLGRHTPLPIYGLAPAVAQARRIHDAFEVSDWPGYPGACWRTIAAAPSTLVIDDALWEIRATPGAHTVPAVGLRITDKCGGGVMAYSGDTAPSPSICAMAHGAKLLVHEATGAMPGHSSALQAAQCAKAAEVSRLILVHLPPTSELDERSMAAARAVFAATDKGVEGGSYPF